MLQKHWLRIAHKIRLNRQVRYLSEYFEWSNSLSVHSAKKLKLGHELSRQLVAVSETDPDAALDILRVEAPEKYLLDSSR